jgi:hypothetical protein
VGPEYVKITYDRKQVKDAPSIGTDGELPAGDEEAVFKHYGLAYQPGPGGERRLAPPLSRPTARRLTMTALFLLLIIAAIALGIVGVVAKGLLYLLIIGIVVFLRALLPGALPMRRRRADPGRQPPGQSLAGVAAGGQLRCGRRDSGPRLHGVLLDTAGVAAHVLDPVPAVRGCVFTLSAFRRRGRSAAACECG